MKLSLTIFSYLLNSIDLKDLWKYVNWHEFFSFFNMFCGYEHYRLLSQLSWQFPPNTTLIDIGTSCGYSAVALSHNPDIKVISYNIQDDIKDQICSAKHKPNIELRIKNCMEDIDLLLKSPLIMLDTAHYGDFETELIKLLITKGYKGIVICDDIYLNKEMLDFWNWVPLKKIDITDYGHWSGTGAIIFDETNVNIEIINHNENKPKPTFKNIM
jgi:hypothetical protein